jgi:hypothetical protein
LQQPAFGSGAVPGLYEVTAMVVSVPSRVFAMIILVLFGMPTLAGVCYGLFRLLRSSDSLETHADWIKLSFLLLVASWIIWYVVASVGWTRYLFPASFLGNIFVANMFCELTKHLNVGAIVKFLNQRKTCDFWRRYAGPLFVVLLVCISVPRTLRMFYRTYVVDADTSVQKAALYLNTQTPPGSLIETYDAELFFFLRRPYHYPPDELNVNLVRRTFLYQEETIIDYDAFAADPDYLVVGPHSKQWKLYDRVLETGAFRLVRTYKRYEIYERRDRGSILDP